MNTEGGDNSNRAKRGKASRLHISQSLTMLIVCMCTSNTPQRLQLVLTFYLFPFIFHLQQIVLSFIANNFFCSGFKLFLKKHLSLMSYIIQIYSGITSGRALNGELLYTKILEVNLFTFAYKQSVGKCKLITSRIFVSLMSYK